MFVCEYFLNTLPELGYILYAVLIGFSLIILSKIDMINDNGKLLLVLLTVPMLRIAEVFFDFSFFWKTFAFYLLFATLVSYYFIRFDFKAKFYRTPLKFVIISVVLGILLGISGNYIVNLGADKSLLILAPLIAFSEELWLRGMIQNIVRKEHGSNMGILAAALVYFVFSFSFGILPAIFFFAAGLLIGALYQYTKNITLCMIANLCMTAIILAI